MDPNKSWRGTPRTQWEAETERNLEDLYQRLRRLETRMWSAFWFAVFLLCTYLILSRLGDG